MWLLKDLAPLIAPTICCLCNLSMDSGVVPVQLKQARVLPLLKKPTLDPDAASSYQPISNHSSNVSLLAASPNSQSLSPVQQSTCRSFHSTETALLSVHNDLVHSIDAGVMGFHRPNFGLSRHFCSRVRSRHATVNRTNICCITKRLGQITNLQPLSCLETASSFWFCASF